MGFMVLPNPFLPMQKPVFAVCKTSFPKMPFGLSAAKSINRSWWSKITEIAKLVFKTRKPVSAVTKIGFLMPEFGFQAPQSDLQRSEKTQHGPQMHTWASETPRQLSPVRFGSTAGASHAGRGWLIRPSQHTSAGRRYPPRHAYPAAPAQRWFSASPSGL